MNYLTLTFDKIDLDIFKLKKKMLYISLNCQMSESTFIHLLQKESFFKENIYYSLVFNVRIILLYQYVFMYTYTHYLYLSATNQFYFVK